jgi:hypothetical protein
VELSGCPSNRLKIGSYFSDIPSFYRNLARSVPVEEALVQTRLTLVRSERVWAVGNLVLYTSLSEAAPGTTTISGEPEVRDRQEYALRGIIGLASGEQDMFQGRIKEQIQLGTWLTGDHRPRIITIHGSGGQGKTALARVAAERFAHAWPGGVWAISLETILTHAVFAASLARFLGIDQEGIADLTGLMHSRLFSRLRRLLV